MDATSTPPARADGSHGRVFRQGRLYRFRKPLSGGQFRCACSRSGRCFRCPGYAVTDGPTQGCRVLRTGVRADNCEPIASAGEGAPILSGVIARAGAFGAAPSPRTVDLSIAGASDPATPLLPDSHSLERPSQNAVARKRKRAQTNVESCHIANYKNLDDLSITESATMRRDGESPLLRDSGPEDDRILLFGAQENIRSLSNAEVWGPTGHSRSAPPSGPSCTLSCGG